MTALFGHNGAGKSTLLRAMVGLLPVTGGEVILGGTGITEWPTWRRRQEGIALVPSDNAVFSELTVKENLRLGAKRAPQGTDTRAQLQEVIRLFPVLGTRLDDRAGTLSGGQQRALAIGIALMGRPSVLCLDEPTVGLAPNLAQQTLESIRALTVELGLTVLIAEHAVRVTADLSDAVCVFKEGRVIVDEKGEDFAKREDLWSLF